MFNWLGTWLGSWFGSGDPAPAGAMSGQASIALASTGTLSQGGVSPAWATGTAGLSFGATGTLTASTPAATGQFWAAGFWSAGFWADGFWGVFEQPFPTLSLGRQHYVFTELSRVFTRSAVDQIIAYAQDERISVRDAIAGLSIKLADADCYVKPDIRRAGGTLPKAPVARQEKREPPLAVLLKETALTVTLEANEVVVQDVEAAVVVRQEQERFTVRKTEIGH